MLGTFKSKTEWYRWLRRPLTLFPELRTAPKYRIDEMDKMDDQTSEERE